MTRKCEVDIGYGDCREPGTWHVVGIPVTECPDDSGEKEDVSWSGFLCEKHASELETLNLSPGSVGPAGCVLIEEQL